MYNSKQVVFSFVKTEIRNLAQEPFKNSQHSNLAVREGLSSNRPESFEPFLYTCSDLPQGGLHSRTICIRWQKWSQETRFRF